MTKNKILCSFIDCDGFMDELDCGCLACKKCKRVDGTDCTYL